MSWPFLTIWKSINSWENCILEKKLSLALKKIILALIK